jgi:hypothetical protein
MTEPEAPAKRGRPRPEAVVARDEKVLSIVSATGEAGITRKALADQLVAENSEVKPSEAYLSLFRLRKDEKVKRTSVDGHQVWVAA